MGEQGERQKVHEGQEDCQVSIGEGQEDCPVSIEERQEIDSRERRTVKYV